MLIHFFVWIEERNCYFFYELLYSAYMRRVSYLEVYNEVFYDLLDPAQDPSSIAIAEDR